MGSPEKVPGWQKTFEVDGREFVIRANHNRRNRVPRPHEVVRQMSRGRPMSLVEEWTYEWYVGGQGIRTATLRENVNGTFSVGGHHPVYRTLDEAAMAWVKRQLPRPQPEEAPAVSPR